MSRESKVVTGAWDACGATDRVRWYRDLKLALAVLLIACVAGEISVGVLYCFGGEAARIFAGYEKGGYTSCFVWQLFFLSHTKLDSMYRLRNRLHTCINVKFKLVALEDPHR